MVIVCPAAGSGTRMNCSLPKLLIDVYHKPMMERVLDFLRPYNILGAKYIFILQKQHYITHKGAIDALFSRLLPKNHYIFVLSEGLTEGAACSVMLAEKYLKALSEEELLLINSDQFLDWSEEEAWEFLKSISDSNVNFSYLTFKNSDPKWSYVKTWEGTDLVREVAEKMVISDNANVGAYLFKKANDFVYYCSKMINSNIRHNNEFYLSLVANQYLKNSLQGRIFEIKSEQMVGFGTRPDLEKAIEYFKTREK